MKYTLPAGGYARTTDYVGTVKDKSDESLQSLHRSVAIHNANVRANSRKLGRIVGTLLRVRIKPRGPRVASNYHTLTSEATHYDIYQGEDTEAMYQFGREMDTGMTPGELKKYDKLQAEANQIKWEALLRKRKASEMIRGGL